MRGPWAGSAAMFETAPYLQRGNVRVVEPEDRRLERARPRREKRMNPNPQLTVRGLDVRAVDVPMGRPLMTGGGEVLPVLVGPGQVPDRPPRREDLAPPPPFDVLRRQGDAPRPEVASELPLCLPHSPHILLSRCPATLIPGPIILASCAPAAPSACSPERGVRPASEPNLSRPKRFLSRGGAARRQRGRQRRPGTRKAYMHHPGDRLGLSTAHIGPPEGVPGPDGQIVKECRPHRVS